MKNPSQLPWADLHCHTQASDGTVAPGELVRLAKQRGLKGLCITDHDTVAAYPEAKTVAVEEGIHLGVGIELSCVFEGYDIHLLGYDFDLLSPDIRALCERHRERRRNRNLKILEKLEEEGMHISFQELEEQGSGETLGRPHIAELMIQKGYVASIKEAFYRFLGEGKRCYVRGDSLSVGETIEVIRSAHGKTFIAHPHLLSSSFPLENLLKYPFEGIECFYSKLSDPSAKRWVAIAQKRGWMISGGSDFHGSIKPDVSLGCQGVDRTTFYQIFEHPLV